MRRLVRMVSSVSLPILMFVAVAPAWAQAPATTASQFYLEYRKAFDKAKTIDDVLPYMSSKSRGQVEATPAAERAKMFELIKMMGVVSNLKILKETRTPDGATLTVEAVGSDNAKVSGKVEIVKENGAWKLGGENWSS